MKRIDRLLIKAKKEYENSSGLFIAFVSQEINGSWTATGHLNGDKGSGIEQVKSSHSTQEEAVEALHKLAELHPNKEDLLIFIEDFGE